MSKHWDGPVEEARYIRLEARELFSKNKSIRDPETIKEKIFEAQSRIELAQHYRNPYPRLQNSPPGASQQDLWNDPSKLVKPAYMSSYDDF
ncbi:hypothetical protein PROFUN_02237 [Planoprotostelium fungivorum]|uniref:Complex 1 LYR protein domain-containing protein n=1 Tax=Planoprotostelium fungivorum TaxID=1890364 RepID=A0A2P6NYD5_9EUKA|nr:hypothetical protein PROFUN_02237 [Planoprotostelium fungivorum]